MLWVNLIMDTFAAMALASIAPSMDVMNEKPRKRTDFIISPAMRNNIFGVGAGFLIVLMGLLAFFKNMPGGMDVHHLTVFFTILSCCSSGTCLMPAYLVRIILSLKMPVMRWVC